MMRTNTLLNDERTISLILLLSRVRISDADIHEAGLIIKKGIDWERLKERARSHGVAPLIYKNALLLNDIPPKVLESLKHTYLYNLQDVLRSAHELTEIIQTLRREGIDAVPIKGVVSAEELYEDMALYPSSDIDIMVRLKDIYRVSDIMKNIGYSAEHEPNEFSLSKYHATGFSKNNKKVVEFHTRMSNIRYFDIPEDFWWEDLREREFKGQVYKVLSREKGLIFACLHISMHGYSCLKFLVTVAEILRTFGDCMDWGKVYEYVRKYDIYHPVMLPLYLSSELFSTSLPSGIRGLLRDHPRREKWIYKTIKQNVFKEDAHLAKIVLLFTALQYNCFELTIRMIRWMFPPLEEVSRRYDIPLNSKKIYLYYVLNPGLLLLQKRRV
jgi:hypothetical protein